MSVVVCNHEYWKIGDDVILVHSREVGVIQQVERHNELLVLEIKFRKGTRKVVSQLIQKVES